jgi:alpha-beta hydrolase superfamily lysophospholipase
MKHIEGSWIANDGLEVFSQRWEPDPVIRGVVCLVHGLGEHSGRYAHVAEHLCDAGYVLIAADLRGHGKSAGKRGHIASESYFIDHIDRLLDEARNLYPGKSRFLYGHSLGGILVLFYVLKRQPALTGVMVTGPGLRTALEKQTFKIALSKTMAAITPNVCIPTGLVAEQISRDPEVVQKYNNDALVHDQASFAMAKSILEIIPWVFEHAGELMSPLLIMHGTSDEIAYSMGSEEFAGLVHCDCTLKLWDGLSHEIHNEPEKEDVLDYLVTWLNLKA